VSDRTQDAALLFGRVLVAALLLPSGIEKLLDFSNFTASLARSGIPYAKVCAALDVAIEVLGPVALMVGLWPRWTALALIALTAATAWTTYRAPVFGTAFQQLKQLKIMMSFAVIAGLVFYSVSGPGAWSRTGLRRG
jgi:putative oxidoreductase